MSNCNYILPDIETGCKGMTLAEFIESLRSMDYYALKRVLKFCEEKEYYEWCSYVQNEIDAKVSE